LISIVIPVKKPEPYLNQLLWDIEQYVWQPHEVLVQTEKGLGYAVKCGIAKAKGDILVICDADGSHPVQSIQNLTVYIDKSTPSADVVVGSRYNGGLTYDSFTRKVISRIYCKLAQHLFGLTVKDNMSGFVAVKKEVFTKYPIHNNGFKWLLELLVHSKGNLTVVEHPIVFVPRKAGHSKASPLEAIRTLHFLLTLFKDKRFKHTHTLD
jgi:dolichol-phosphate mannosyltransferase